MCKIVEFLAKTINKKPLIFIDTKKFIEMYVVTKIKSK